MYLRSLHSNIASLSIVVFLEKDFFYILNKYFYVTLLTPSRVPVSVRGHDLNNLDSTLSENVCKVISQNVA